MLLACLALTGCATQQQAAPSGSDPKAGSAKPNTPTEVRQMHTRNLDRLRRSCGQNIASTPTNPACRGLLPLMGAAVSQVQVGLARWFPDREPGKVKEAGETVVRRVELLQQNCDSVNGSNKLPGQSVAQACGSMWSALELEWKNFESAVDKL
ncbi:hypothetical protein GCM10010452_47650 [Crossiella cryophila]